MIRAALTRTGCRFLLDIAHAELAAWHRGEAVEDYLDRLPLSLVSEVHISGPAMVDGELRDRHEEIGQGEYALLELVLSRAPVSVVALEYGGVGPLFERRTDHQALGRQLRRLAPSRAGSFRPHGQP